MCRLLDEHESEVRLVTEVKATETTTEIKCAIYQIIVTVIRRKLQLDMESLVSLKLHTIMVYQSLVAMKHLRVFIRAALFRCDDHLVAGN